MDLHKPSGETLGTLPNIPLGSPIPSVIPCKQPPCLSSHLCRLPGFNFNLALLESVAHYVVFRIAPKHAYSVCWIFALREECGDESSPLPRGHAGSFCEAVRASPALDLVGTPPLPPQVAGRSLIYYFIF